MKKILFILSIVLVGCGYAPISTHVSFIIDKIVVSSDFKGYSEYYGYSTAKIHPQQ